LERYAIWVDEGTGKTVTGGEGPHETLRSGSRLEPRGTSFGTKWEQGKIGGDQRNGMSLKGLFKKPL